MNKAVVTAKLTQVSNAHAAVISRAESLSKLVSGPKLGLLEYLSPAERKQADALDAWEGILELALEFGADEASGFAHSADQVAAVKFILNSSSMEVCPKCKGSGGVRSMVAGGVCFRCNGRGFF